MIVFRNNIVTASVYCYVFHVSADNHARPATPTPGQRSVFYSFHPDRCRMCVGGFVDNGRNRSGHVPAEPHPVCIYFLEIWGYKSTEIQCLFLSQGFQLQGTQGRNQATGHKSVIHCLNPTFLDSLLVIPGNREGDISGKYRNLQKENVMLDCCYSELSQTQERMFINVICPYLNVFVFYRAIIHQTAIQ